MAIINPASIYINIGAIQAHTALSTIQASGLSDLKELEEAKATLQEAYLLNPGYLDSYDLLGRIQAWEGNPILAMEALTKRVEHDGNEPLLQYYPSAYWLRQIEGGSSGNEDKWNDLIGVYSQWKTRYPDRAELYTQIGVIWQCYMADTNNAAIVIEAGIEAQAKPIGLLEYYQKLLSEGDTSFCN